MNPGDNGEIELDGFTLPRPGGWGGGGAARPSVSIFL